MKPLLEPASTKYLRRLVRALNAEAMTGNGFYASTPDGVARCNRARLSGECLEVKALAGNWFTPEGLDFFDAYECPIFAFRG